MPQENKLDSSRKKLRLSPSTILRAGRCPHTVAMEIMFPSGGVAEDIKSTLAQGYYFEHCLTGKRPEFREQPAHESYYAYLSRAHEKTIQRIDSYAKTLRGMYLPEEFETGIYLEHETPEFVLCGEMDIRWMDEETGESHIVDAKYMANANDALDPYGRLYITEFMMQPPTYGMLDCIKQSNHPDSLYAAAVALMRKQPFEGHLNDFMAGVTIPRTFFLACEPREVEYKYDAFEEEHSWGTPLHKYHEITITREDLVILMVSYITIARSIDTYVLMGNKFSSSVMDSIQPDEVKCLGKNTSGKHGGYCPWVSRCIYGQTKLFNKSSISLSELWAIN